MKKNETSVATLLKNAKNEWKQANKSLMFTLNLMNNAMSGKNPTAPALLAYIKALGFSKIEINNLCKDSAGNVVILRKVSKEQAENLREFFLLGSGAGSVRLRLASAKCNEVTDYIMTKRGTIYRLCPMQVVAGVDANNKPILAGGFSFVGLIDSISHKVKCDNLPAENVAPKAENVAVLGAECSANYLHLPTAPASKPNRRNRRRQTLNIA